MPRYNQKYMRELEDLITDELFPMYIIGCRATGIDPRANEIIARLMDIKGYKEEVPYLLRMDSPSDSA